MRLLIVYSLTRGIQMIHVDLLNSVQTNQIISSLITKTINSRHTRIDNTGHTFTDSFLIKSWRPFDVNRSYFRLNLEMM